MSKKNFKIRFIENDWIFLNYDETDLYSPDSFVKFVMRIKNDLNEKIINLGDMRYKFENDKLNLIYQWDSCFGIVVEYNSNFDKEIVIEFLEKYF